MKGMARPAMVGAAEEAMVSSCLLGCVCVYVRWMAG